VEGTAWGAAVCFVFGFGFIPPAPNLNRPLTPTPTHPPTHSKGTGWVWARIHPTVSPTSSAEQA